MARRDYYPLLSLFLAVTEMNDYSLFNSFTCLVKCYCFDFNVIRLPGGLFIRNCIDMNDNGHFEIQEEMHNCHLLAAF